MSQKALLLIVVGAFLTTMGCGSSKLPKYADRMTAAEVAVEKTAPGATVDMKTDASDGGDNPLEAAMNVASAAASATGGVKVKDKFSENFSGDDIKQVVRQSVEESLGEGRPFRVARDGEQADARLTVDVYQYGIEREGSSPSFIATYDTKITFLGEGGETEVWSETVECKHGGLFEETDASVTESVGFVAVIDDMSDEEFRQLVRAGFEACSDQLVKKIREDAEGG